MRNIKKVVSTGCLFFCLGGWVYNGQAIAADEANQGKGRPYWTCRGRRRGHAPGPPPTPSPKPRRWSPPPRATEARASW